jgi:creatinine amidohydrolase
MRRPYILAESNWKEIQEQTIDLAILPWGATEAHNYHLPYGTDNYQVEAIAAESARIAWENGAGVTVLPVIPFGINSGQMDVKLCMNMHPSTQAALLNDLLEVLDNHNIRKLLILNGHGGNSFKSMVREAGVLYPEMVITTCNWFQVVDRESFFEEPGDHADEMESSVMLHLQPDLVQPLESAGDGSTRPFKISALNERWVWKERDWTSVTADTGVGSPYKATADKGKRYVSAITRKLATFLEEFAEIDPDDLYE